MAEGPSRSWADAITNEALIAGLDASSYLSWVLVPEVDVNPAVPAFVHEYTHHWCFNSLVGSTVAGLYLRARESVWLTNGTDDEATRHAIVDDLVRYHATTELLRPFAEGLALFAECDFRPGPAQVMSPLFGAILACFGLPVSTENDPALFRVNATLQLARRSVEFCERKAGLLAKPMSVEDGYLLGYLAVKALWRSAALRFHRFLDDREEFLTYLRAWVYSDAGLVCALLDPNLAGIDAANAITKRIRARLNAFLACDLDTQVPRWAAGEKLGGYAIFDGLEISSQEIERANELLEPLLDGRNKFVPNSQDPGEARIITAVEGARKYALLERGLLTLCEVSGEIVRDEDQLVFRADGGAPIQIPKDATEACALGAAEALVLFEAADVTLACLVRQADDVFVLRAWGHRQDEVRERFLAHARFAPLRRRIHDELKSIFDAVVSGPDFDIWIWHTKEQASIVATELWEEIALLDVRDDAREVVRGELRQAGIYTVVGCDEDVVRAIAAVGVANTLSVRRSDVEFLSPLLGVDLETLARAVSSAGDIMGMKLLIGDDDFLYAVV